MVTNLRAVLDAIGNSDTLILVQRRMKIDIMDAIVAIQDPWVQAQVQKRHHIRMGQKSPLKSAIFSKNYADGALRRHRGTITQAMKSNLAQQDRKIRLKEEAYGLKMAKVS